MDAELKKKIAGILQDTRNEGRAFPVPEQVIANAQAHAVAMALSDYGQLEYGRLEAENCRLKAEIERLQDLQSPEHERLWEASKAAMQAALSGKNLGDMEADYFRQVQAKNCVSVARALIAEVDGSVADGQ